MSTDCHDVTQAVGSRAKLGTQQYIDAKGDHGDALFLFFSLPSLMLQAVSALLV